MTTTLIAVVVALVLGHLAPSLGAAVRHYGWYRDWLRWLDARFPGDGAWRGRWGIALALSPPLLAVGLFQLALREPLLGLAGLAFGIAALFYVWGPGDLDVDVDAIAAAGDGDGARREAAQRLWPEGEAPVPVDGGALVGAVFENALRRWFGPLLWFLLLGPFGALLYRFAQLSAQGPYARELPAENRAGAERLLALLDWPVAQLMTLSLALVGNFDIVLGAWREAGGAALQLQHRFLHAAARASVKCELADEAADYFDETGIEGAPPLPPANGELPELRDAMSLIWRSLLVWLAALALFVIAGWAG
ncbi:regulatory signaling modulator protein AmpE [Vulcaniibacterium tengchongense]|uniref:regulatory signaling modulator protein AmpE n=1 Tax=Vulcaniibacterium tengchongense TaxID=1273429 RepID=UPI000F5142E6|nr:regulatory signaling modulator protein AmpE [Vulcaniibacterium tengchongense]